MLSSLNQIVQSSPSLTLIFISLLILIILVLIVGARVLIPRSPRFQALVEPQSLSAQTIDEQEDVREQQEETQEELEEALRRLANTQEQLEAVWNQREETQEQLEATRKQLADAREQLEAAQKQQEESQEQLEAAQKQLAEIREQLERTQQELRNALEQLGKPGKRDDLLTDKPWIKLAQECVTLFDELDRKSASMDPRRQELAGYVCSQLEEILERSGVTIISGDLAFDESRHRPYPAVSRVADGTAIAETLSPGFVVGPRVLRRARVRLADEAS
jgi:molecular chaperone GrpE (heat shock protein)